MSNIFRRQDKESFDIHHYLFVFTPPVCQFNILFLGGIEWFYDFGHEVILSYHLIRSNNLIFAETSFLLI